MKEKIAGERADSNLSGVLEILADRGFSGSLRHVGRRHSSDMIGQFSKSNRIRKWVNIVLHLNLGSPMIMSLNLGTVQLASAEVGA